MKVFKKRRNLIEFHEQSWVPNSIKNTFREVLEWVQVLTKAYEPLVPTKVRWVKESGISGYLDLCTGSGGLAASLLYLLRLRGVWPQVQLTDLYPYPVFYENLVARHGKDLSFSSQSVDATNVVMQPLFTGRTINSAFHHFSPAVADSILKNAAQNKAAIFVAEPFSRDIVHAIAIASTAFFAPFYPFFSGRFSLRALLWCVVFPVVIPMMMWDGFASVLRAYTAEDFGAFAGCIRSEDYVCEVGHWRYWKVFKGIYLMGMPRP